MTLQEIKQAIKDGETVCWSNESYKVILDKIGQYLIHCTLNDNYTGLTWQDGETLNGYEDDFFILNDLSKPKRCHHCGCESSARESVYVDIEETEAQWCGVCIIKHAEWTGEEWQATDNIFDIGDFQSINTGL